MYTPLQTQRAFECISQTSTCQLCSKFGRAILSQQLKLSQTNQGTLAQGLSSRYRLPSWFLERNIKDPSHLEGRVHVCQCEVCERYKKLYEERRKKIKHLEASPRRMILDWRKSSTPNIQITTATMKTPYPTRSSPSYAIWWPRVCSGDICGPKTHPFCSAAAGRQIAQIA